MRLIDADALNGYKFGLISPYAQNLFHKIINEAPTIVQEQRTGRWINARVGKMFPSNDFKCSECGNILDFNGVNCGRGDANYCPNCGAKMQEVEE